MLQGASQWNFAAPGSNTMHNIFAFLDLSSSNWNYICHLNWNVKKNENRQKEAGINLHWINLLTIEKLYLIIVTERRKWKKSFHKECRNLGQNLARLPKRYSFSVIWRSRVQALHGQELRRVQDVARSRRIRDLQKQVAQTFGQGQIIFQNFFKWAIPRLFSLLLS